MFTLHPTLATDSLEIGELELCQCRLINNMLFPWFLLIPKVEGVSEIVDLSPDQQQLLMQESVWLSECLRAVFEPDRINVAALGNQVPQLHVHHIARFKTDAAWPNPVWGGQSQTYSKEALEVLLKSFRGKIDEHPGNFVWSEALTQ
jgi:diadenosine tetraphosphate (Ap4A) HIT family hydrolase